MAGTSTRRIFGTGLVVAMLIMAGGCTSAEQAAPLGATTSSQAAPGATAPSTPAKETTPTATCQEITRFGEAVVSTGFTYDYTPSTSPAALAEQSEVVVVGTTTGDAELIPGEPASDPLVVITVEVNEVLRSTLPEPLPPTIEVRVPVSNGDFGSRMINATAEGIPVVTFLSSFRGGLAPQIEGLVTACDAPGLLGGFGFQGLWATIESLDELAAAVRA